MSNSNNISQLLAWTGERYLPEIGGSIELEHLHRYVFAAQFTSGKSVLDIASGEGYGSALLAKNAVSVVGVDISPDFVAHASTKYQADNLEFRLGSCAAIPLVDQCVEIVVSFETIEHHDEHEAMMREIKRVLLPGGLLIISTPDKLEYSDKPDYHNPYHVKELYRQEFTSLLEVYFKNHRIAGQRVIYGSAIFNENSASQVRSYDLSDKSLRATPGIHRAVYLIAVASDTGLPLTENCVLEASQTDIHQKLILMGREHDKIVAWADKVVAWARDLNHALNLRDREIADLELSKAAFREQLTFMRHERDEIFFRVLEGSRQISSLSDELDRTLISKDFEIDSLQRHLNEIIRSRSWRMTAPMRRMMVTWRNAGSRMVKGSPTKIDAEVAAIKKSGLFDEEFYRLTYQDLQPQDDVVKHYCKHGWREGRNPSANFDTCYYLLTYSDIRDADINPFWHYVVKGVSEKRHATGERGVFNEQIDVEVEAIKKSGLFDEWFYPLDVPGPRFAIPGI